jgi:hypothetical protein
VHGNVYAAAARAKPVAWAKAAACSVRRQLQAAPAVGLMHAPAKSAPAYRSISMHVAAITAVRACAARFAMSGVFHFQFSTYGNPDGPDAVTCLCRVLRLKRQILMQPPLEVLVPLSVSAKRV